MLNSRTYSAKILLFGEYTILNGSKALAVPYHDFSGCWTFEDSTTELTRISKEALRSFLSHTSEAYFDYARLKADIEKGLWFSSTIPNGFGLGSSGALIAAIFETYGRVGQSVLEDKFSLAKLEDYFHGSSSGIDPLVSLLQKPLLIHTFDHVEVLNQEIELNGFFLLNTGRPRNTGPLVNIYREKMKDPEFKRGCAEVLSREVNFTIDEILKGDRSTLSHHLWLISKFQWEFFPEMIPTQMRSLWAKGLDSGDYILKLCGAGGGGFVLGYTENDNDIQNQPVLNQYELRKLS